MVLMSLFVGKEWKHMKRMDIWTQQYHLLLDSIYICFNILPPISTLLILGSYLYSKFSLEI